MKRIWDSEKNCLMAVDGEYEFELSWCIRQIKAWKMWYFKKNYKKPCTIRLRCLFGAPDEMWWIYFLELSRNGKMESQTRVCKEAYDYLKGEREVETMPGQIEFVTLEKFEPCH